MEKGEQELIGGWISALKLATFFWFLQCAYSIYKRVAQSGGEEYVLFVIPPAVLSWRGKAGS